MEERMKAHLTKLSLALLSAGFLFGCQEQGSGPVGPEGPQFTHNDPGKVHGGPKGGGNGDGGGGGGGTGGNVPVGVTVAGGMNTGTEPRQLMQLKEDDDLVRLNAYAPPSTKEPYFILAINMTATHAAGIAAAAAGSIEDYCVKSGPGDPDEGQLITLFGKLVQDPVAREVLVRIDKTALVKGVGSSEGHLIALNFDIKVLEQPQHSVAPRTLTVTVAGNITGDFTATFSGGNIRLTGNPTGKNPDHFHLTCEIQDGDEITFDVLR